MFKKLTFALVIALLCFNVVACSSAATTLPTTGTIITTTGTKEDTKATETEEQITPEAPEALTLSKLISLIESGEYGRGDEVIVSGFVFGGALDAEIFTSGTFLADAIFLAPEKDSEPGANLILKEDRKVKVGQKITMEVIIGQLLPRPYIYER